MWKSNQHLVRGVLGGAGLRWRPLPQAEALSEPAGEYIPSRANVPKTRWEASGWEVSFSAC